MRRRPPATIVVYIGILALLLVSSLIAEGAHTALVVGGLALAAGAVGLWLGSRIVWIVVTAAHVLNVLVVVNSQPAWSTVAASVALLGLLLAPPTWRHVRPPGPGSAAQRASRGRRALRVGVALLAGLALVPFAVAALYSPDPISGDLDLVRSDRPGSRVLIVGNAIVSWNSMIEMLRDLAEGDPGTPPIFAVHYAPKGSTLIEAARDERLQTLLEDERWNHVVLQEHSQVVSRPSEREKQSTRQAAIWFDAIARRSGARTAFLVQGAYRDGDEENVDDDTYAAMQARVIQGYAALNTTLRAAYVPVGRAWAIALREQPEIDLWHRDDIRPSREGSYLIACVLYATLTGRDPVDSSFTGDLERPRARALQDIARRAVDQQ
ncbi:MAG TPA: DUF4886 domain-containing protein [Solirubrobacteraceae bacterium]|nr:DUF4886 domain-containing protein [Solirubrobacteraceae bacterium]